MLILAANPFFMKQIVFLIVSVFLTCNTLHAQDTTCLQLLLHQKGTKPVIKDNMQVQSSSGFYLYRNCIYNISLINGAKSFWQIIDFTKETLTVKKPFSNEQDTIVKIADLERLYLLSAKNPDWYADIDLRNYEFVFEEGTKHCKLDILSKTLYKKDETLYELFPYLTIGGIRYLYEEDGNTFVYQADLKKRRKKKVDDTFSTRYGIWFTPNKVERIYGIALGLNSNNTKNKKNMQVDSLSITGLNIEFNPQAAFKLANSGGFGPFADDISYYYNKLKKTTDLSIKGLNISFVGTNQPAILSGFNIGLVSTVVHEQYGVTISGLNNFSYESKGIAIAALVNRTTKGKGLQIAAFNRSENFIGVQIGIWNVIGDKSRPIVNWNFKNKKGK